jgi:hypothetical protein
MRGSIRFVLGLLITFGAVGTIEVNPDANLILQTALAVLGLGIMSSGIAAFEKEI